MKVSKLIILFLSIHTLAYSQPNFTTQQNIEGFIIIQDAIKKNQYYYLNNNLELEKDANTKKPSFKFVRGTYTGSHKTNDKSSIFNFHSLSFTVVHPSIPVQTIERIKEELRSQESISLSPLPLQKIGTAIVIPLTDDSSQTIKGGFLETPEEGANWTLRNFTMNLNLVDGKLLWDVLSNKNSTLSLVYEFYARGVCFDFQPPIDSSLSIQLHSDTIHKVKQRQLIMEPFAKLVSYNTLTVSIDTSLFPKLLQHVDLNTPGVVAQYPILNVQFEDFIDGINGDLCERIVEIIAEGFNQHHNREVKTSVTFDDQNPSDYFQKVFFKHPVRTDRPFKVKITDIYCTEERIDPIPAYIVRDWGFLNLSSRK